MGPKVPNKKSARPLYDEKTPPGHCFNFDNLHRGAFRHVLVLMFFLKGGASVLCHWVVLRDLEAVNS